VSGPPPRLIFASPSVNFPLGRQMSEARREAMLAAARNWNAVIFECDSLWELSYTGDRIRAMQGHDRGAPVLYFGDLNQTLGPHIRVGYLVVPPSLVGPFTDMALRVCYGPEPFVLGALATFIEDTDYAVHAKSLRSIYAERLRLLVEAIRIHIRDVVVMEPSGGLHVTMLFNDPIEEQAICSAAADRGLSVTPLSRFYHAGERGTSRAGIVLGFGTLPDRMIETMVRRLAEVVMEVREGSRIPALVA
jgi:GntR family transcriptional regulator/MocR family aminotransferase